MFAMNLKLKFKTKATKSVSLSLENTRGVRVEMKCPQN